MPRTDEGTCAQFEAAGRRLRGSFVIRAASVKKFLFAMIAGALVLVAAGLVFVGPQTLLLLLNFPRHAFADDPPTVAPDYASPEAWARYGTNADAAVDVFFIHPTGYFRGERWNSPLDPDSAAAHNRRWMMANMASVFDDFAVYAPKYREATIYAFLDADSDDSRAALALAYADVREAFEYFLTHISRGRPFILAGHSQGTLHGLHCCGMSRGAATRATAWSWLTCRVARSRR